MLTFDDVFDTVQSTLAAVSGEPSYSIGRDTNLWAILDFYELDALTALSDLEEKYPFLREVESLFDDFETVHDLVNHIETNLKEKK